MAFLKFISAAGSNPLHEKDNKLWKGKTISEFTKSTTNVDFLARLKKTALQQLSIVTPNLFSLEKIKCVMRKCTCA